MINPPSFSRIMMDPKDRYIAEAAEHGRCTENGDYKKGNMAYDRLMSALAELRGHAGPQSQLEFNAKMVLREWRAGRLKVQ
jgi:hypothetical protein